MITAAALPDRKRGDQGFTTPWMLGLCAIIIAFGLFMYDVWGVYSVHRQLSGWADASAAGAAAKLSEDRYLNDGEIVLDTGCGDFSFNTTSATTRERICTPNPGDTGAMARIQQLLYDPENPTVKVDDQLDLSTVVFAEQLCGSGEWGALRVRVELKRPVQIALFEVFGGESDKMVTASSTASPAVSDGGGLEGEC